jgi:hypothetical protein
MEAELAVLEGALECGDELAAEDATEHLDGKKEPVTRTNPARVIERQAAGGNHAMDMRVKAKFLVPGVENAEEPDFGAEVSRISGDFHQCFRTGAKQEIVDELLVLHGQWRQLTRKREDNMHVARREKFSPPCGDPAFPGRGLAFRTVPVAAGVVGDGAIPAAGALIEMTAECGSTTARNGPQHFDMLPIEPVPISFEESSSRGTDEIGHLQGRPTHLLFQLQRIQRTGGRVQMALRKMQVDGGLFEIAMT